MNRLLLAMLKKYRKLVISMIMVSTLGVALLSGLTGNYESMDFSLAKYADDYKYADICITAGLEKDESGEYIANDFSGLLSDERIYKIAPRLVFDTQVRLNKPRPVSARIITYSIKGFQEFFVREINEKSGYINVCMDYKFAEQNGINAGDLIEIRLGDVFETVCVGSTVSSPEGLNTIRNEYSWGENSDFGYIYVPENALHSSELYGIYNQVGILAEAWAGDHEKLLSDASAMLEAGGINVVSSYTYKDSPLYFKVDINLKSIKTLSIFLPLLFFASMLVFVWLFLSQMITQCRRDIGILRALGFSKRQVVGIFSEMTLISTSIACIAGLLLGAAITVFTTDLYASFFRLPVVYYKFSIFYSALAVVLTLIIGQAAVLFSSSQIASVMPSEAMTRMSAAQSRMPGFFSEMIKNLSAGIKYAAGSVFRNTARFVFSVICISMSLMLIFVALSFEVSKNTIIEQMYEKRMHYDVQLFFSEKPSEAMIGEISAIDGVSDVEPLEYYNVEMKRGDDSFEAVLCSLGRQTSLVHIYDADGRRIQLPEDQIIIEKYAAKALKVRTGDKIFIDGHPFFIYAVSDQCVNRLQYISDEYASGILKPDQYTLICNCIDDEALIDWAINCDSYEYASFTEQEKAGNIDTLRLYTIGVAIVMLFAVMLGFLVVYNTTQTNLYEQKKEISVLRSLGFKVGQISRIWYVRAMMQFFCSCLIGIPPGRWFARLLLSFMAVEGRDYPYVDSPVMYVLTIASVFAYLTVSHFLAAASIRKWDIVENIKEKE